MVVESEKSFLALLVFKPLYKKMIMEKRFRPKKVSLENHTIEKVIHTKIFFEPPSQDRGKLLVNYVYGGPCSALSTKIKH